MDPRTVLLVTDIDLAAWALRRALTSAGFVVLTAGDADAARAVVETSDPFDVQVISQSLGDECVSGLLDDAARLWPGVPAIVLAVDAEPAPLRTLARHVVLEKPYSVENVVALACELCGQPGAEAAGAALAQPTALLAPSHDRES